MNKPSDLEKNKIAIIVMLIPKWKILSNKKISTLSVDSTDQTPLNEHE